MANTLSIDRGNSVRKRSNFPLYDDDDDDPHFGMEIMFFFVKV